MPLNPAESVGGYHHAMLFLMNDAVLRLDPRDGAVEANRFRSLSLSFVLKLGAEMFAEDPLLHQTQPDRAHRLALLIGAKTPQVNAALFAAPRRGCKPEQVVARLAEVSIEVMSALYTRYSDGLLTPFAADREVWRRMAA